RGSFARPGGARGCRVSRIASPVHFGSGSRDPVRGSRYDARANLSLDEEDVSRLVNEAVSRGHVVAGDALQTHDQVTVGLHAEYFCRAIVEGVQHGLSVICRQEIALVRRVLPRAEYVPSLHLRGDGLRIAARLDVDDGERFRRSVRSARIVAMDISRATLRRGVSDDLVEPFATEHHIAPRPLGNDGGRVRGVD